MFRARAPAWDGFRGCGDVGGLGGLRGLGGVGGFGGLGSLGGLGLGFWGLGASNFGFEDFFLSLRREVVEGLGHLPASLSACETLNPKP